MTSVLYSSGLNYQGRNPMGNEVRAIDRRVHDIEVAFSGVKSSMESFIEKQKTDAAAALTAAQAAQAAAPAAAEFDVKIGELRSQLESVQALLDVIKLRLDKTDTVAATASAAAAQAKTLATAAAADAASATAQAAAAAAAVVPASSA